MTQIFRECRTCSILGAFISISGILIASSVGLLGYSFFEMSEVKSAKKELDTIKHEYQSTLFLLKKVSDFSPNDYDAIDSSAFSHAIEAIEAFKNLFIAQAIIATKSGSPEDALGAWRQAVYINPDNMLCNYGLGMEYFKSAINSKNQQNQKDLLEHSIHYLSHKSLSRHPQALYHLALSNLRYMDFKPDKKQKYELARNAIIVLNNTDKANHPVGNVERNLAYAYCKAAQYSPDRRLAEEYREKSEIYFNKIRGLVAFDNFYERHHDECMKLPKTE